MSAKEAKEYLRKSKWNSGPIACKFLETSFSTSSNIMSHYDVEEKDGKLYLTNTDLRNKEDLLLIIDEKKKMVVISPRIDGDTGFSKIILSAVDY